MPRAHVGADNVHNLVWSCRPCNEKKGDQQVAQFLQDNPERRNAVLRKRPTPLASAGQHAAICETLLRRLEAGGLETRRTTGADTAVARRAAGLEKSHANAAACCRNNGAVKRPRKVATLKATGHGRRKQIKGLPLGPCLAWRHQKPAERRAQKCPLHAHHPNTAHGVRTGDTVRIASKGRWVQGRAQVEASKQRVTVRKAKKTTSTSKTGQIRRVAPRCGYREAN